MLKTGTFLQNRYEIISRIGSGGMADVYKARDHKLNRFVAVKILKPEYREDTAFLSKFRVEAQAAAGLSHANIVNVYDVGEDRGIYFIVMELVEGITLKAYIAKKGKLSVREATSIALQVCAGLESAHNNGIIHRDVKPQNIIISKDGKAKVADFGIARAANSDTINSSAMGSVHYSSPEQSRGGYSDAKSDIYSMGITMFEMLTGRVPFDGDSTVEVALRHLQEDIPSPRKFTPEIPFSTEQIILKCTQKSPDRRYSNMAGLIRDLRESLVNPGGNFVVIPQVDRKAHTVELSREELSRIKKSSIPTYDNKMNVGAAQGPGENGGAARDGRIYPYGGNYYQNSGYQDLSHNQRQGGMDDLDYQPDSYDNPYRDRMIYPDDEGAEEEELMERRRSSRGRRSGYRDRGEEEWDDDERSARTERLITIISIVAAVAVGLVILYFVGRGIGLIGKQNNRNANTAGTTGTEASGTAAGKVEVPEIRGKTEEEARELLKNQSLGAHYVGESSSTEYAKGLVMTQSIDAGSLVDPNTTVDYVLSTGSAQTLTVPDLSNKTQEEAQNALTSMGLLVSVDTSRYSDTFEEGRVINTNPGAGSAVKAGDTVTIFISQGQEAGQVQVPEVEGHYASEASELLGTLGLYVYLTEVNSDTVEKGVVISQDIPAGTSVSTGSAITLTVSAGSANAEDIEILNSNGTWMCNAQLNAPEGWNGEPVRIDLVQGESITTVFEGETSFPFILNVTGQSGYSTGTVFVYTLDPMTREVIGTTRYDAVSFEMVG